MDKTTQEYQGRHNPNVVRKIRQLNISELLDDGCAGCSLCFILTSVYLFIYLFIYFFKF